MRFKKKMTIQLHEEVQAKMLKDIDSFYIITMYLFAEREKERGQWAVYFTSPKKFSYSLA